MSFYIIRANVNSTGKKKLEPYVALQICSSWSSPTSCCLMAEELIQATRYLEPLDPWCICLVLPTQNMSGVYPLVRARSRFFGWPQVLVVDQCCVCNLLYACLIYQCHGMSLIKLQEDPSLPFPGLVTVVHSEEARFVGSLKSNMFWNAYSCSQWNDFFPCLFFIWGCPCFVCIQRCSVAKFDYLLDEVFQKKQLVAQCTGTWSLPGGPGQ